MTPSGLSSVSRYKSNFEPPLFTLSWVRSQPAGKSGRVGSSENITWKNGLLPARRSGRNSFTSSSNGTWPFAQDVEMTSCVRLSTS